MCTSLALFLSFTLVTLAGCGRDPLELTIGGLVFGTGTSTSDGVAEPGPGGTGVDPGDGGGPTSDPETEPDMGGADPGDDTDCVPVSCVEQGVECGDADDGCDAVLDCGACPPGEGCVAQACICAPDCFGKQCGDDGCGGSCGDCETDEFCNLTQLCQQLADDCPDSADCSGQDCGPDPVCGTDCGDCPAGEDCGADGMCDCVPVGCLELQAECGAIDDGCGATITCGSCAAPSICENHACVCVPDCAGKQCGDDGCGGVCGTCATSEFCNLAQLCETTGPGCPDNADCTGQQCGPDPVCGTNCGDCAAGETCNASGVCECVPQCVGKQCGDDGCGGVCGDCELGYYCASDFQCYLDAGPSEVCQSTQTIVCGGWLDGNNLASSADDMDAYSTCGATGQTSSEDVFEFVAEKSGTIVINLTGSFETGDTNLFVLEQYCAPDRCVESGTSISSNEEVVVSVVAGRTYYVVIDGKNGGGGDFTVQVDCDNEPDRVLFAFEEMIMHESYGFHRLLIGPSTSDDPLDGTWTVVADETAMNNPAFQSAPDSWLDGLRIDLTPWASQGIRFAFHYFGYAGDEKWYVENLCVGLDADGDNKPDDCYYDESFGGSGGQGWPPGWDIAYGAENSSPDDWRLSTDMSSPHVSDATVDLPTSALHEEPTSGVADAYLLSQPFLVPAP